MAPNPIIEQTELSVKAARPPTKENRSILHSTLLCRAPPLLGYSPSFVYRLQIRSPPWPSFPYIVQ
jgi:hypothetical protein